MTPRAEPSEQFLSWDSQALSSWDSEEDGTDPKRAFKDLKDMNGKLWDRKSWTSSYFKDHYEDNGFESEEYSSSYDGEGF